MKSLIAPASLVIFLYSVAIVAVVLDLFSGVRKAKERGEYRSSRKLRLTVEKLVKYFNMLAILTCIDVVQVVCIYAIALQGANQYLMLPWFTAGGVIFVCIIEFKSVFEKSSDKQKADIQDAAKLLSDLLSDDSKREMIKDILDRIPTKNEQTN